MGGRPFAAQLRQARAQIPLLGSLGQIYANSLFLSDLFDFLALRPQVVDPPRPAAAPTLLRDGIAFRNVAFTYPGSERAVLRDCTLTVPAGRIVAIVGPNGAGKSTLIKLLCRFYDPTAGSIELDGTDVRALAVGELRRRITVLFQEPVRFSETVAVNIALGDMAAVPGATPIEAAAQAAGAAERIARLPHGYETLLGKWFGGADLIRERPPASPRLQVTWDRRVECATGPLWTAPPEMRTRSE